MKFIFVPLLLLFVGGSFSARRNLNSNNTIQDHHSTLDSAQDSTLIKFIQKEKKYSRVLLNQGKSDSAILVLNHCLTHLPREAKAKEEIKLLAWTYVNRAYIYEQVSGDYLSAKSDYLEGLRLFQAIKKDDFMVARFVYQPLGNIYTRHGENEQAIRLLSEFKRIAVAAGKTEAVLSAYNDLGRAFMNKRDFTKAEEVLKEGIALSGQDDYNAGLLYSSLARTYFHDKKVQAGIDAANNSIYYFNRTSSELDHSDFRFEVVRKYVIGAQNVLGLLLTDAGQFVEAKKSLNTALKDALDIFPSKHRKIAKIYCALGDLEMAIKNYGASFEYYHQALIRATPSFSNENSKNNPDIDALFPEVTIGEALCGKALAASKQGYSLTSDSWKRNALNAYQCYFLWENKIRAEQQDFYSKLHFSSEIHKNGEEALNLIYSLQNTLNTDSLGRIAHNFIHQSKGILLSESNARLLSGDSDIEKWTSSLRLLSMQLGFYRNDLMEAKYNEDSVQIANLQNSIAQLDQQLQLTQFEIRKKYHDYDQLIANNELPEKELAVYLKKQNANLLNFFQGETYTYLLVVDDSHFNIHRVKSETVQNECNLLLNQLKNPKKGDALTYQQTAHNLYNTLISPSEKYLSKNNWIILPDGVINTIPFEALVSKKRKSPTFKNLHYLVKKKTAYYTPTIEKLLVVNSDKKLEAFLGIAPDYSSPYGFPNLQYAEDEISYGASTLNGKVLTKTRASKSSFLKQANKYRVLHLSTHAGVDSISFNDPWLTFADDTAEQNQLTTTELLQLQLMNDLVILNACETGSGYYYEGEGTLSFARSFMDAGSRNILTNLWSVNHTSNHKLLKRFYDRLSENPAPAQALQLAKQEFLQNNNIDNFGAHPYFWTPLILIGNNQPIKLQDDSESSYYLLWIGISGVLLLITLRISTKKIKP